MKTKQMKTKQIPRKHAGKKVTSEQDYIISEIKKKKGYTSWLEAKHEYFENQAKYDKEIKFEDDNIPPEAIMTEEQEKSLAKAMKEDKEPKEHKKILTISETKLGITMVLTKQDCKAMGFTGKELTREAIKIVRARLKLPEKPMRG